MQDQPKFAEVTAVLKKEDELKTFCKVRPKKVLLLAIGRVKVFLLLIRPHSGMCIKMYIFKFKKQQTNNNNKRKQASKKAKEHNEEKRISPENRLKK